ncbi:MAG: hypothetical protein R2725_12070 [Solirubrobacterales bacterium]
MVGSAVYVGGRISEVNGEERDEAAASDAETGELLPWAPEVDGGVLALTVDGEHVYLGGKFGDVNGASRDRLAAVDDGESLS